MSKEGKNINEEDENLDEEKKSEELDDSKKRKSEPDPYNFFRFSTEPLPENNGDDDNDDGFKRKKPFKFPFFGMVIAVVIVIAFVNMFLMQKPTDPLIDFSTFRQLINDGKIVQVELGETEFVGYGPEEINLSAQTIDSNTNSQNVFNNSDKDSLFVRSLPFLNKSKTSSNMMNRKVYRTTGVLMSKFIEFLDEKGIQYKFVTKQSNVLLQILINILPFLIIIGIYFFMFRKMTGGIGGGMGLFGAGGNRSKAVDEGKVKTRFVDVAGVDEAKEELVEVVDFLKEPKKYTEIGGKIPKGVLLVGPPGTGKTLLARAVAGEAGVPFFSISGSDFVEMFVGVGASRVRDLFKQAREKAPCIVFIDEIDALGKSRMNGFGGGNDEREQTLNQLLVEMDGFENEKGLIILAATNRADILDPALLRPGRFDRQVPVERPDVKGREAILKIHSKNVKLEDDVDFESIAHGTTGFAGADLANVVNEAALLAVRNGRKKVTMLDFNEAIDKVRIGLKKKSRKDNKKEIKLVSVHETGHAIVGAFTPDYPPVNKITVVPRSHGVGGFTDYREREEKTLMTKKDILSEIDTLLGGRAAEQVIFDDISTGASNDIARATEIIKSMIVDYGMSDKFKNMTLGKGVLGNRGGEPSLVREFSEETQKYIDEEISRIMNERYDYVVNLLTEKKDLVEYIANRLIEIETMDGKEFYEIVNGSKHCDEVQKSAEVTEASTLENVDTDSEIKPNETESTTETEIRREQDSSSENGESSGSVEQ